MTIIGNKTVMRALEIDDCQMLLELINDPETEYLLGGWSFPVSYQMQVDWLSGLSNDKETLRCVIESKDDKTAIGTVILSSIDYKNGSAEIQIKISDKGQRGKGYGSDAIYAIIKYGFEELRLNCIYARVSNHNVASKNLFVKCGFKQEGLLRQRLFKRGQYIDIVVLSILNRVEE
jgi:RimJ/RimL family protein N-acetyltransferase